MTHLLDRPPLDTGRLAPLAGPAGFLARLEVVDTSSSTNAELARLASSWPAPAALVAEHQTAGRGRAGRTWETPARAALTVSVLLRPDVPAASLGWLPLLAGLAVVRALEGEGAGGARVKWPNDVLLPSDLPAAGLGLFRKVSGILAEVVPDAGGPTAVVVGIGLNVTQGESELPVGSATSLALAGATGPGGTAPDRTGLLVRLLGEVSSVVGRWEAAGGDVAAAGLDAECAAVSATLGTRVRAELAGGGGVVEGEAVRLDVTGALVIRTPEGEETVSAGDVHHLR
ncbi:biotin--[acetyl-CoA-carboxylase] ligase [Antribacter gilvus]|uniref:biotin--[acetyl-CoA-carboxylase] ligase n=1 Tax=Antribacter gilvus TaxID=2304675 RepID=UPI001F0BC91F|nr:biotin--[acetyl-CoA-carboxylase] ligase [Antribacter gilvus]